MINKKISRLCAQFFNARFAPDVQTAINELYAAHFKLDLSEFAPASEYASLQALFTRRLQKPRAIETECALISPCDGTLLSFGRSDAGQAMSIKNRHYCIAELLGGDAANAEKSGGVPTGGTTKTDGGNLGVVPGFRAAENEGSAGGISGCGENLGGGSVRAGSGGFAKDEAENSGEKIKNLTSEGLTKNAAVSQEPCDLSENRSAKSPECKQDLTVSDRATAAQNRDDLEVVSRFCAPANHPPKSPHSAQPKTPADADTDGEFDYINIYLSPRDYHHYHAPCDMQVLQARYFAAALHPVNLRSLRAHRNLYAINERVVLRCRSAWGEFYMVFVGALNVGRMNFSFDASIKTNARLGSFARSYSGVRLARGEHLGNFELGSTILIIGRKLPRVVVGDGEGVRFGKALAAW